MKKIALIFAVILMVGGVIAVRQWIFSEPSVDMSAQSAVAGQSAGISMAPGLSPTMPMTPLTMDLRQKPTSPEINPNSPAVKKFLAFQDNHPKNAKRLNVTFKHRIQ